eukprot:scaffold202859_cov42-Prasinocladus_malaysianus.AAC.1
MLHRVDSQGAGRVHRRGPGEQEVSTAIPIRLTDSRPRSAANTAREIVVEWSVLVGKTRVNAYDRSEKSPISGSE